MSKRIYILLLLLGISFFPSDFYAQDSTSVQKDNLGNVNDKFQEYFFEALKQQAIDNHEKALDVLEKCVDLRPEEAILYVELGKNHKALENYPSAVENFEIALQKRPESPYVRIALYEVYAAMNNYSEAIRTAKDLVEFYPNYYRDLANLYMMEKKPELALESLDKIDNLKGQSDYSENLRREIYAATNDLDGQIAYLKTKISENPENQENYLELINLYGKNQELEAAFSWAKKLESKHPDSEKVHLALYQLYLSKKEYEKAIASMKKVLEGKELEEATKIKVLRDFVDFTQKNPEYENALAEVLDLAIKTGENKASNKELGDFYASRDKAKALGYYKKYLENNFNDVEAIGKTIALQLELEQYEDALALSKKALGIFPSRPKLYFAQGTALNYLKKYEQALEVLDFGLSYLIDNPNMESNFYQQMAIAHRGLQHQEKAAFYEKKVAELKNEQK